MNLSISLGIIIKNEEQRLFYLLSKLSSYFDETIVINNQSTDKSKIILQQFNSRIIDTKINGDFSALYNLALINCKTDYIFFIDADEDISLTDILRLIEYCKEKGDVYYFDKYNYTSAGTMFVSRLPRLLKVSKNIYYEGIVFNQINTANLKIINTNLIIHHFGFLSGYEKIKEKYLFLYNSLWNNDKKIDKYYIASAYLILNDFKNVLKWCGAGDDNLLFLKACVYLSQKDYLNADNILMSLLDTPNMSLRCDVLNRLGISKFYQHQYSKCICFFSKALKCNSNLDYVRYNLAQVYLYVNIPVKYLEQMNHIKKNNEMFLTIKNGIIDKRDDVHFHAISDLFIF